MNISYEELEIQEILLLQFNKEQNIKEIKTINEQNNQISNGINHQINNQLNNGISNGINHQINNGISNGIEPVILLGFNPLV